MIVEGVTQAEREQAMEWVRCLTTELERVEVEGQEPATADERFYLTLLHDKLRWFLGILASPVKPAKPA